MNRFTVQTTAAAAILALAGLFAATARAETVKRSLVACVTEDLLDEVTNYSIKGDTDGVMQLIVAGKCTILQKGDQVSVISPGFIKATIRYKGVKLYTPSEAVR